MAHVIPDRGHLPLKCIPLTALISAVMIGFSSESSADEALDARVQKFLDDQTRDWRDLNVPYQDGKILHDIVVEHGFTWAVEIGTSTGHSTIWIAWGFGNTGGRLTTVEIDEQRYKQARANVTKLGVL